MLKFFRSLFLSEPDDGDHRQAARTQAEPPADIVAPGVEPLAFPPLLQCVNELPVPDWDAVSRWLQAIPKSGDQANAWSACEVGWLQHLRAALGSTYSLAERDDVLLLSSLDGKIVEVTLDFMSRTRSRIMRLLSGVARVPEWGKDILIVVEDEDTYYRYVSRYYPEDGEFAGSSGMHISTGCSHFVTMKADLRAIEPVIAHEMTHGCLGHLPIPAWLNEGIAVNTEHRLCPPPRPLFTPGEMHEKHLQFWGKAEIQQFWSGRSFLRSDDGNMLSYDLARILVAQFSSEWEAFRSFVLSAELADAGASAARVHLGLELGAAVAAILEKESDQAWHPDPETWDAPPEEGAFQGKSELGSCNPAIRARMQDLPLFGFAIAYTRSEPRNPRAA